jgi:type IV pilus assembly protein PilV
MRINAKGFSLIEVMVAIVILTIGLIGVAGLQSTAIIGNQHGNTMMQATTLAEETIEQIRNADYDDITAVNFPELENDVDGSIYDREILIEDDTPLNELKRITVTVSWRTLRRHQVVLRTIVSDEG